MEMSISQSSEQSVSRLLSDSSVTNRNHLKSLLLIAAVTDPKVLIEGVLFRARYLGSTQLVSSAFGHTKAGVGVDLLYPLCHVLQVCEGQPTKATRMIQAEEAVSRIKVSNKRRNQCPTLVSVLRHIQMACFC